MALDNNHIPILQTIRIPYEDLAGHPENNYYMVEIQGRCFITLNKHLSEIRLEKMPFSHNAGKIYFPDNTKLAQVKVEIEGLCNLTITSLRNQVFRLEVRNTSMQYLGELEAICYTKEEEQQIARSVLRSISSSMTSIPDKIQEPVPHNYDFTGVKNTLNQQIGVLAHLLLAPRYPEAPLNYSIPQAEQVLNLENDPMGIESLLRDNPNLNTVEDIEEHVSKQVE